MSYFVIRQKATGFIFPITGRGSTWAEFRKSGIPRLFPSRHAAKCSLDWWLGGKCRMAYCGEDDGDGYDLSFIKTPERKPDDYEIVPAELHLKGGVS